MKPLTIQEFIEQVAVLAAQNEIELKGLQFSEKTLVDYNREIASKKRIILHIPESQSNTEPKTQNVYSTMIQISALKE